MLMPSAITPDAELEHFFGGLSAGFRHAQAVRGCQKYHVIIAGRPVRICLAGENLHGLLRPLAHLPCSQETVAPDLEICVWESPERWVPPSPVWKQGQQGYQGEVLGLGSGRFQVNYHDLSGLFHMFDRQASKALYWIPRIADLPYWEIASPFRILFHWWARHLGGHLAHAAAVGQDGSGILLVGKSGSGKSTTSLICLRNGMEFVGDDYVLLLAEPIPTAHSLYSSAKMHSTFLDRALPTWKTKVACEIGPEGKSVFFLQEFMPQLLRPSLGLRAIVIPQIGSKDQATLTPRSAAEGLLALAPSTLFQLPEARRDAMTFFSNLLRGLPVYALKTGSDLACGPHALRGLLGSPGIPKAVEVG